MMFPETINTHDAVQKFQNMLQRSGQTRVLCLEGASKMGKSHLLTKVFPALAKPDFQDRYAILDLRDTTDDVPNILTIACSQLKVCESYSKANETWINRPKINLKNFISIFSFHRISAKDSAEDIRGRDRHFTTQFVKDLDKLDKVLLLFDSVDCASPGMQMWLMNTLLAQLSSLAHVLVVVVGRTLPEPHGSYAAFCERYQLRPVEDEKEYIAYCQNIHAKLGKQTIRAFAKAFDYKPGLFAEYVYPKFRQQELSNG